MVLRYWTFVLCTLCWLSASCQQLKSVRCSISTFNTNKYLVDLQYDLKQINASEVSFRLRSAPVVGDIVVGIDDREVDYDISTKNEFIHILIKPSDISNAVISVAYTIDKKQGSLKIPLPISDIRPETAQPDFFQLQFSEDLIPLRLIFPNLRVKRLMNGEQGLQMQAQPSFIVFEYGQSGWGWLHYIDVAVFSVLVIIVMFFLNYLRKSK